MTSYRVREGSRVIIVYIQYVCNGLRRYAAFELTHKLEFSDYRIGSGRLVASLCE